MRKIINGKKYDTETARLVGERASNLEDNLTYVLESLYKKRTGEFFLAGEGGPMTSYRTYIDANSWRGGSKITPLTEAEAREWAANNLTVGQYEAVLGPVAE